MIGFGGNNRTFPSARSESLGTAVTHGGSITALNAVKRDLLGRVKVKPLAHPKDLPQKTGRDDGERVDREAWRTG